MKALAIPVLAMTSSGEERTTFGKATGLSDRRQDEQFAATLAHLDQTWRNVAKMVNAIRVQWDEEDCYEYARKRLVKLVKAELTNRKTADLKAKTADLREQTVAAQVRIAESERRLVKAQEDQQAQKLKIARLQEAIEACYERAEAGHRAQQEQRDRNAAAAAAREERERDDWLHKASEFQSDPMLRGVYLARAAGELDDDE
jgi:hypothetical protein